MDSKAIFDSILSFILVLYGDPNLPRKIVQDVVDYFNNFIKNIFLRSLKNEIVNILKENQVSENIVRDVELSFEKHSSIFDEVFTEKNRFNVLKKKDLLISKNFRLDKHL